MPLDEWGEWYDDEVTPTGPEQPSENLPEDAGETPNEPAPSESDTMIGEWNITQSAEYIRMNAIDNEDFLDADDDNKARLLNISARTLRRKYAQLSIPVEAIQLFGAVLASTFNDTTIMQQRDIASFSVKGLSFTFKGKKVTDLADLITQDVLDLISDENGVELRLGVVKKRGTLNGNYTAKANRNYRARY